MQHQRSCADVSLLVNVRVPIVGQAGWNPLASPSPSLPVSPLPHHARTCNVIAGNIRTGAPLLRDERRVYGISALACYWILRCGRSSCGVCRPARKIRACCRGKLFYRVLLSRRASIDVAVSHRSAEKADRVAVYFHEMLLLLVILGAYNRNDCAESRLVCPSYVSRFLNK